MTTKYKFDAFDSAPVLSGKKKNQHRRQQSGASENEDNETTDGNGSLTYSAASSINSATGESTDSSLAGIMRVLDVDSKELAAVLEKERIKRYHGGDRSVAAESQHSLAYSTDVDSHMPSLATEQSGLQGTGFLTEQPSLQGTGFLGSGPGSLASGQYEYDTSDYRGARDGNQKGDIPPSDSDDLIFAPAEHTDSLKRRKDKKRQEKKKLADNQTPRVKNSKKSSSPITTMPESESPRAPPPPAPHSAGNGVPYADSSRPPKGRGGQNFEVAEEEDIWYAKWWMFCFPDAVKTMTPKR